MLSENCLDLVDRRRKETISAVSATQCITSAMLWYMHQFQVALKMQGELYPSVGDLLRGGVGSVLSERIEEMRRKKLNVRCLE